MTMDTMTLTPLPHVRSAGPPTLSPGALRYEQYSTLATSRGRPNMVVSALNLVISLLYGRRPSLPKSLVLEHLAQVPYRSWERIAQRRIVRTRGRSALARRIQMRVAEARAQHDNEQWHMLVLEELLARRGQRLGWLRYRLIPRLMAAPWQLATWILHLVKPRWSYLLNAAFEDHAEREYMRFVATNPALEREPFTSQLADRWNHPVTVADVLRQIGYDERCHKLDSIVAARGDEPQPTGPPPAALPPTPARHEPLDAAA
jgi:ubiquinol oxidase